MLFKTRHKMMALCTVLLLVVGLFSACGSTAATVIEMELTENYDTADPFVNEKLIYLSDGVDALELAATFEMQGESGTLEIADNETGQVFWSESWQGTVEKTSFAIPLKGLEKERDYVIRFTGTGIRHAKIVITCESKLVKERQRPQKPGST